MTFAYVRFAPPAELQPFLQCTFHARGRIPYRFDKILPNGLAVVVFNNGAPHRVGKSAAPEENPQFRHSWLHGVQTTPVYNMPSGETHVLGLLFEPIGFHALFGVDMRTLADRTQDARDALPAGLVGDIEANLENGDEKGTHTAIHDTLLARTAAVLPSWLWGLYDEIKASRGGLRLARAYAGVGRSPRHASARLKRAVGVSPKVLCRIHRLQALLEDIDPARHVNWTELAHRFEFFDQAHFNREFRKFSGLHPNRYLAERRRDLPELGKGESVHFAPQR